MFSRRLATLASVLALAVVSPWRWHNLKDQVAALGQDEVSWEDFKTIAAKSTTEAITGVTDIPVILIAFLLMLTWRGPQLYRKLAACSSKQLKGMHHEILLTLLNVLLDVPFILLVSPPSHDFITSQPQP